MSISPAGTPCSSGILIICTSPLLTAAMKGQMRSVSRRHFGHFEGWAGSLGGRPAALVQTEAVEEPAYVAVRHMVPLLQPSRVVYLGKATAVCETLLAGDLALVAESRPVFGPVVVTDNMFPPGNTDLWPDDLIFPDTRTRDLVLDRTPIVSEPELLERALDSLQPVPVEDSVQGRIPAIRTGSGAVKTWNGRAGEFLRRRFGVDAVDGGVYGALSGCQDLTIPALALLVTTAGKSGEVAREFQRNPHRYARIAAETVLRLLDPSFPSPPSRSAESGRERS